MIPGIESRIVGHMTTTEHTEWRTVLDGLQRSHKGAENVIIILLHQHPGIDALELRDTYGMPVACARRLGDLEKRKLITYKTVNNKAGWYLTGKADSALAEIMPRPSDA